MDDEYPQTQSAEYHAERCPVCNGFGTLKYGTKVCQGCDGKGYVIVPNGNKRMDGEIYESR